MKAVGLTRYLPITDSQALLDIELPKPIATGRDLLVRVEAISVNPVDTKIRHSKPDIVESSPRILGWDAAGIVEAVGPQVTLFKPGDAVFYAGSIARPGANSEFHLTDERIVGHKPKNLGFAETAALPLTAITAWETLFDRLGISSAPITSQQTILLIGGAGGVGSIAIQLAKKAGLIVLATASRPETHQWCLDLGADHIIDHREPLRKGVEAAGFSEVDFIANFADTDHYWKEMAGLIRPQGKIASIVENKGPLEIGLLKNKSATFVWEFMFTRAAYQTPDMGEQGRILNQIAARIDAKELRTTLSETRTPINAANLRLAHQQLESGRSVGKLVLTGWA